MHAVYLLRTVSCARHDSKHCVAPNEAKRVSVRTTRLLVYWTAPVWISIIPFRAPLNMMWTKMTLYLPLFNTKKGSIVQAPVFQQNFAPCDISTNTLRTWPQIYFRHAARRSDQNRPKIRLTKNRPEFVIKVMVSIRLLCPA